MQKSRTYVRKSGGIVIKRKGATFHAIAATVSNLCACILNGVNTILTVSSMMHGEYGIEDVCLSMPDGHRSRWHRAIASWRRSPKRKLRSCTRVQKA